MCLGIPGRVLAIEGASATADFLGVERSVRLDLLGEALSVGDYVLQQTGYAVHRVPADEAAATLELFREILREVESADVEAPSSWAAATGADADTEVARPR